MKYFTATAFTLAAVQAQSENRVMNTVRQMAVSNNLMSNSQMASNGQAEDAVDRALTQADMGLLNDYGCWCFFETSHGKGKGKPVDELDSYCKTLHDGYECIMSDAADAGIDCIPWEEPYNSAFGSGIPTGLSMQGLADECDTQNPANSCARWTCKVEGWFVQQYFLYSTSGGVINAAYRHENGFDNSAEGGCPISNGVESEKACCGNYPLRFPFKTYSGARDCCQTHTYNTNLFQCCSDGKVRMVC